MTKPPETTLTNTELSATHLGSIPRREVSALAICWSDEGPGRLGEVFLVGSESAAQPRVIGRGHEIRSTGLVRLLPHRQRPWGDEAGEPLASKRLSRENLLVRTQSGCLEIKRVGKNAVFIGDERLEDGVWVSVHPGMLIECERALLMMVCRRPDPFSSAFAPALVAPHIKNLYASSFGAPDVIGTVGESTAWWQVRLDIAAAARVTTPVLIWGPTGCGKEHVGRGIHLLSKRATSESVTVNTAALYNHLIESQLFGNVENYPNRGDKARLGYVAAANGSTLILDELGDIDADLQSRLLRVIDNREVQRLGIESPIPVDVRFVAATLKPENLREDLMGRFGIQISVPSIENRREDLPLMARHVLSQLALHEPEAFGRFYDHGATATAPRIGLSFMRFLMECELPDGVRGVRRAIIEAAMASPGNELSAPSPGRGSRWSSVRGHQESGNRQSVEHSSHIPPKLVLTQEQNEVRHVLQVCRQFGHQATAARQLGLTPGGLSKKVARWGLGWAEVVGLEIPLAELCFRADANLSADSGRNVGRGTNSTEGDG